MTPDTDTEQRAGEDAEEALERRPTSSRSASTKLGDDIDEAKQGLRARKEDADDRGRRRQATATTRSPSTTRRPTRTTRTTDED